MENLIIAAAQTIPVKGDVDENIKKHISLIDQAHQKGVDLIVFPELSLTGYEPELARALAFTEKDERLNPLMETAYEKQMILVVGAPIQKNGKLHIGAFIIYPNKSSAIYTKRYLHTGEDKFFDPGELDPQIELKGETVSLAICADINNASHPKKASSNGANVYIAGVLWSTEGYKNDIKLMKDYATNYKMLVVLSNFGGDSGGYEAAGKSMIFSSNGEIISEIEGRGEGLAIARRENGNWFKII
ncbi:MAG: carbon-nitrogen hydrolase family protein [Bacteroidales bacterium]|nr:carbon-nitrogen hydrolase family protein [Bacteroidales bacterium]